jgi:hypothetical protein
MAISPNTTFVSGAILTAAQMNALPWGIVAFKEETSNLAFGSTETVSITASTFTAVANRYYRITYFEPQLPQVQNSNVVTQSIKITNTAGTRLSATVYTNTTAVAGATNSTTCVWVGTFTAGSKVIIGSLLSPGASVTAARSATLPAQMTIEDIGPA